MTISEVNETYVWLWLLGETKPCVVGKLIKGKQNHVFYYAQSYLERSNAIALAPNLPLNAGQIFESKHALHLVFRDTLPDAWGRRVLQHCYGVTELTPLQMLHLSSSDRIGALHFQASADMFEPLYENHTSLEVLSKVVELLEDGQPLPASLDWAIVRGTSVGGARPKALIDDGKIKWIAKFSSSTDVFPIVQTEYAAMWLAKKLRLNVANIDLQQIANKYVLLVERFDRSYEQQGWCRLFVASGLSLLNLDDIEGRYASYLDLADQIRRLSPHSEQDLHELFKRMVFNIIIGNTDDHGKNHAFFWDGKHYALTPAYDLCPYPRSGQEATQAMVVGKYGSYSTLNNALSAAQDFGLSTAEAKNIIDTLVAGTKEFWPQACTQAQLTEFQAEQFMGTAILNPYIFYR